MTETEREALELCDAGLQHMWKGEVDFALAAYDRASVFACSEDTRELITIRKAEALIAAERDGAEIAALPGIVMRRRSPRHVYLAANTLQRRYCENDDRRKAIFYGEIARAAATEVGEPIARASVLNHLGITLVADSQLPQAATAFAEALDALAEIREPNAQIHDLSIGITANLGGTKILCGQNAEGIALIEMVLDLMQDDTERAEAYLDLCIGYLNQEDYATAEKLARQGLDLATTRRQVRNANHLLGEICLRLDRYDESDAHFDVVAGFYPEFKNVKQLLVAVDLCSVVNWKA